MSQEQNLTPYNKLEDMITYDTKKELFKMEKLEIMDELCEEEENFKGAKLRTIFDMESRTMDLRKRRSTDLMCNDRVLQEKACNTERTRNEGKNPGW